MDYKIFYIEDLDPTSIIETLKSENFNITQYRPDISIDNIINKINKENPDIILMDYKLTEETKLIYCNAPTIASTLRTKYKDIKERPIILMSTDNNIINLYKKDYTNQDLFDYVISKEKALGNPDYFRKKCLSFYKAYRKISDSDFNLNKILGLDDNEADLIHSKIKIYLNKDIRVIYEYSRFIYEHLIRHSGLLIGEDILSARLGVNKECSSWNTLKSKLLHCKYTGIFSDIYDRWWMSKINLWWEKELNIQYPLRQYEALERVQLLKNKLEINDLVLAKGSSENISSNYWTICKETKLPLDPFDGIELLDKEYKSWQDKEYISIEGALLNLDKYKKIISESDRKELRNFNS
ncbi:hypothetical protein JSO54_06405 [Riemerella anatipestifer]|uniref:hypothetical protein n=1 Tax=Riemerella anatipestifer TaxID=34085 RepID=UPI001374F0F8|nr:hypothetical protein [Riemerella anatipestifer]